MSKRMRSVVIGGVAVLALVAVLVVLLLLPETPADTDGDDDTTDTVTMDPLIDKSVEVEDGGDEPDIVEKMTVTRGGETFTVSANADGVYRVEAYDDLPADESAVDILLDAVEIITPNSKLETVEEDLSVYGFDEDSLQVSVTYLDGDTYAFEVGDLIATGSGYYYREKDSETVYTVGTSFVQTLDEPSLYYVGRDLTTAPELREGDENGTAQMMKVEVTGKNRDPLTIRYKRETDSESLTALCVYLIEKPYLTSTNLNVLSDWQTGFNNLGAMEVIAAHPTAAQKAEYGLDDPAVIAKLTLGVYTQTEDEDGNVTDTEVYNSTTYTLRFGKTDENGDYYAMLDGLDVLYLVGASDAAFVDATFDDVVLETPLDSYIQDVERVVVTADGETHTFDLTHIEDADEDEQDLKVTADGDPNSDPENFRSFYGLLVTMERYKGITDAEADAFLAKSPAMTLEITLERIDGNDENVKVYTYDGNRSLIVRKDGRRYLVKTANVETVVRQLDNVLAGKTVVEIY